MRVRWHAAIGEALDACRNGHERGMARPGLAHPGGEQGLEEHRIDPVRREGQPAPAGNAVMAGPRHGSRGFSIPPRCRRSALRRAFGSSASARGTTICTLMTGSGSDP